MVEIRAKIVIFVPTVRIVTAASAKKKRSPKKIKLKKRLQRNFVSIQFMDVSARNLLKKLGFVVLIVFGVFLKKSYVFWRVLAGITGCCNI